VRVVIGSDHPLIREGLSAVIETTPNANIVSRATDWQSLLAAAEETHPDLVLLDVERPGFGWVRAVRQIHRFAPEVILACISSNGDMDFLEEMSAAGAITKSITNHASEEALNFVRRLSNDQNVPVHSASIAGPRAVHSLTAREREILRRIARGSMSQEIAKELGLSIRTVEFHRANILRKTGARTTADVTRYAIETGALPSSAR
jgi:two-component system, NarL family, nitrate/nitrite response regulator NarL